MVWVLVGLGVLLVLGIVLGVVTAPKPGAAGAVEAELRERTGLAPVDNAAGTHLAGTRDLGTVRYEHRSHSEGGKDVSVGYWRLEPRDPPTVGLQLIERRLVPESVAARAARAVADEVMGSRRTVQILYPGPVPIGVPALDERFLAFADDSAAVARLAADPELPTQLLACAELDLCVSAEGVTLHDPARLNLGALMGPVSALETDAAVVARATIVAHERVIALLQRVASRLGPRDGYR